MRRLVVFDKTIPWHRSGQPCINRNHPRLDVDVVLDVLKYMDQAPAVVGTTQMVEDVVDSSKGAVVNISQFTDGVHIWDGTVPYYLLEYLLSPGAEFVEHCRQRRFVFPELDSQQLVEAFESLNFKIVDDT